MAETAIENNRHFIFFFLIMELTSENVYIVNGFSFHDDLKAIAFESHKVTENIVYLTHGKTDKSQRPE